uniref:SAP domain-containing protein n=1 Tax=Strigamia maritima TaxID=126957 RepID=T1JBK9_STRMM
MAEGSSTTSTTNTTTSSSNNRATSGQCGQPLSPPKCEVDETPIQKTMDKNKESLKVKLMLRRPIAQLVDQGILPSLKTPPAFHEQRQKLERAKMGDLLKSKIQRRPDRQELIQQHILEDSKVAPSLQDRQRQLKKARLADDLNDRLSHRPGPLELIKGNILKTDDEFAQAVKEGQICFKKTSEGETRKHPPPMFVFEEDSSSEGTQSPIQDSDQSQLGSVPSVGESVIRVTSPGFAPLPSGSLGSSTSPPSSISSPCNFTFSSNAVSTPVSIPCRVSSPPTRSSSSSKSESSKEQNRNRKKSKSKSQPKARTIKFHEYKGPPNAQKSNAALASSVESSYDLLLQQQQLFLQWQLEWQHKYPQIILPAQKSADNLKPPTSLPGLVAPVMNGTSTSSTLSNNSSPLQDFTANRCLSKLEEMKVSDLKAELKKRNLPVSGSKPQLIQRLKPYTDIGLLMSTSNMANNSSESNAMLLNSLDSGSPNSLPDADMTLDLPLSPKKEVNNNTFPACMSPDSSQDGTPLTRSVISGSQSTTNTRPPSVAPMDVDVNCNPGFDAMDVTDNNALSMMANESTKDIFKKKIDELQREIQKECETWQVPEQNAQFNYFQVMPNRSPAQIQPASTISLSLQQEPLQDQLQQKQHVQFTPVQTKPNTSNSSVNGVVQTTVADPRTQQRLQQHIQQKLLQNQSQPHNRQQTTVNHNGATMTNAKANLAAFLLGQDNVALNPAGNNGFFNPNNVNNVTGDQHNLLNQRNVRNSKRHPQQKITERKIALSNKSSRQNCVPNYAIIDPQTKREPPPDYNEATKQLNKVKQEQFAQRLMNNLGHLSGQKSVKSQAVDEVLELLIANGELPPSAAQDPATPTTPKSLPSGIIFSNTPSLSITTDAMKLTTVQSVLPQMTTYATSSNLRATTTPSPPPPPPLPPPPSSVASLSLLMPQLPIPSLGDVGLGSPDLDVNLDLDSFETMDIGQLSGDVNNVTNGDLTDHMEIDVSDWLDEMMPPTTHLPHTAAHSDADSGDPLLSNSQDPLDLFTIDENDFKTPTELNILNWDKVDFAT